MPAGCLGSGAVRWDKTVRHRAGGIPPWPRGLPRNEIPLHGRHLKHRLAGFTDGLPSERSPNM
ncbi:hypothetical protein NKI49_27970 [Mesorhizobium sp. M0587]